MAVLSNRPYGESNFIVDLGTGQPQGFLEVLGLGLSATIGHYRNGNEPGVVKSFPLRTQATDVTFRRGINGDLSLYQWFDAMRNGNVQRRTIRVDLLNEANEAVFTWRLVSALPVAWATPRLNAAGDDVAIEELLVTCERLEVE